MTRTCFAGVDLHSAAAFESQINRLDIRKMFLCRTCSKQLHFCQPNGYSYILTCRDSISNPTTTAWYIRIHHAG